MLTRYLHSAPGLPLHYHLILPNIYGKGENPGRIIPYLLDSLQRGSEIKLTSGSQVRQYLHAADVASCVLHLFQNTYPAGLYNLCNREAVQIRALVKTVFRFMHREGDFGMLDFGKNQRNDTSMPFLLLENKKTLETLGFSPSVTLEEGIGTYLK
jgi:nucleoside-diphosphate-sugar epimerase